MSLATQRLLLKAADFYDRNPTAFQRGAYMGSILADFADITGDGIQDVVILVREAIGMADMPGALMAWCKKHTPAEAAALLRGVAAEIDVAFTEDVLDPAQEAA